MTISFRRKCGVGLSICLLLITQGLRAQNTILSLQDLTNASQQNQPSILKKQALINSAEAAIKDAKHTALPTLKLQDQLSFATANSEIGSVFPLGSNVSISSAVRADNNYQPASGNVAMLYSEYELENFGLNKARVSEAQAGKALSEADLAKDLYLLKLKTARFYFQLLKAYQQLNIEQDNVIRYDTLFVIIRAQAASGLRAGADSAQTKAELSKARVSYNTRMQEIMQLKQDLSYLTGVSEEALNIDTALSRYQYRLDQSSQDDEPDTLLNPLVDYYNKQKNVLQSQERFIKKSYLPKILLAGGAWGRGSSIDYNDNYQSLSTGLGYQRFNYGLGLAFNYNLFDMAHRHDKLAVNKYKTQQSDYELQEQKLQLRTASVKALAALSTIDKNRKEIPVQIESAQDLYQQKLAQYQAGVSNLVDLTNAGYLLLEAQTANIQIITDWYLAKLDKAAADGNLGQFIQSIK